MARTASKQQTNFWQSRRGNLAIALVALLAMYLIASRAIETGSLQQYALTIILLAFAMNRLVKAVRS